MALAQEQEAQGRKLKLSGVTGEPQRVLKLSGLLEFGSLCRLRSRSKEASGVTHLKCPDYGISLLDRSGVGAPRCCPRCLLRSGAVVEMIRGLRRRLPGQSVRPKPGMSRGSDKPFAGVLGTPSHTQSNPAYETRAVLGPRFAVWEYAEFQPSEGALPFPLFLLHLAASIREE